MSFRSQFSLSVVAVSAFASIASAGITAPELQLWIQKNDGDAVLYTPGGIANPDGTFSYEGNYWGEGWAMDFSAVGDTDPFVSSVIGLSNGDAVVNVYTITVILPTIAVPAPNLIGGSVGGSVTDANADGVGVVTSGFAPGSSLYVGLIDGAPVLGPPPIGSQLYPNPTPFIAPFAGGTANIPALSFGLPGPFQPNGIPVLGSIGITLQFSLTPGDDVALTSFFQVEPIPGPGALALLGIAGLVGSRRRR